ncbi:hypothetical protein LOTGIDRAFT_237303 [Lottia gigantea]|uniref:glutathione transferase n=1 Tax=Lottia gigantea TaxID=225164 RepID=V4AK25_LOTGI|nr:hypothetical protein LOTGIDRAFT_237303 [Lottia gigantea]ESP04549.1 hypothetical protein LOTGIDRAFT_237303 [Lottia gigantea]
MTMVSYKIEYFNVRGRCESIRYLLTDNDLKYTEDMIQFEEWSEKYKPKMPYGQAPAVYDGDFQLVQSNSILRYLGRKHGLYPTCEKEAYKVDMLNDGVEDLRVLYIKLIYNNYDDGKADYIKELPARLKPFENILKVNGAGESGFAANNKLSFLDYNLFDLLDNHVILHAGCLDDFPTLKGYYQSFKSRAKLAEYRNTDAFKSRPVNGNSKQ